MKLRDYLDVVWRRRFLVLVAALLGAVAVWLVGQPSDPDAPTYSGELTLRLRELDSETGILLYEQVAVNTPEIVDAVVADLGEDFYGENVSTLDRLERDVQIVANDEIGTLELAVVGQADQESAIRILSTFGRELMDYARERSGDEREDRLATLRARQTALLETIELLRDELDVAEARLTADERATGVVPDRVKAAQFDSNVAQLTGIEGEIQVLQSERNSELGPLAMLGTPKTVADDLAMSPLDFGQRLIVGVVLAALLGCGLALTLHRFDSRLFSRKDTEAAFRLPVLSEVPRVGWWRRRKPGVLTRSEPGSAVAESFRLLRSSLAHTRSLQLERLGISDSSGGTVTLVSSVARRTGKSTTVANLAVAAVDAGKSVLVIGGDLRQPAIHDMLGVDSGPGIVDAVGVLQTTGHLELHQYLSPSAIDGITVLSHGGQVSNPGETLAVLRPVIDVIRSQFDIILIDSPPMLAGNDVSELVPFVDLMLLVARAGKTTVDEAEWADETAARLEAPTCGVALVGSSSELGGTNGALLGRLVRKIKRQTGVGQGQTVVSSKAKEVSASVVVVADSKKQPVLAPAVAAPAAEVEDELPAVSAIDAGETATPLAVAPLAPGPAPSESATEPVAPDAAVVDPPAELPASLKKILDTARLRALTSPKLDQSEHESSGDPSEDEGDGMPTPDISDVFEPHRDTRSVASRPAGETASDRDSEPPGAAFSITDTGNGVHGTDKAVASGADHTVVLNTATIGAPNNGPPDSPTHGSGAAGDDEPESAPLDSENQLGLDFDEFDDEDEFTSNVVKVRDRGNGPEPPRSLTA